MKSNAGARPVSAEPLIKPLYLIVIVTLGLTGLAQLPMMKRYYIADIPGLGWLGEYYITHTIHYIGAAGLLFLAVYCLAVYLSLDRRQFGLTVLARIRIGVLAALIITGIVRVLKNLPEMVFPPAFVFVIDISHLGLAVILMLLGIYVMIGRTRWLEIKAV